MRIFKSLFVPVLVLVLWQAVSGAVSPYLLPGPARVLETGLAMAKSGMLGDHVLASFARIAAGFCLSVTLAFAAAALLYRWKILDELFQGSLSFMRMTPPLALIAAELIAAGSGLGYMIMDAEQMQRADEVIVGILIIGFLGWALDAAFSALSSALLKRRFPELAA